MIKCTGIKCPIQYNPEEKFDPSKCRITDICDCATPLTDEELTAMMFMLLCMNAQSEENLKIQECLTPPPTPSPGPYVVRSYFPGCGCHQEPQYKTDCYYYYEEQDMHAHIPCCSVSGEFEPKNCNEFCKNYITKKQVADLAKEHY